MSRTLKWMVGLAVGLIILVAVALAVVEHFLPRWITAAVEERTGREFRIEGDFDVDWSLSPLLTAEQLRLANAEWSDQEQMMTLQHLGVRIRLLPLLTGKVILPELNLREGRLLLERNEDDAANWSFKKSEQTSPEEDTDLPEVHRLSVEDVKIRFQEQDRNTDLTLQVQADPDAGKALPLHVDGQGRYRSSPFELQFRGDSPLRLFDPQKAYELQMEGEAADTHVTLDGEILDPQHIGRSGLQLNLAIEGPDPARLKSLTGLALPSLPPYHIEGRLLREGRQWGLDELKGTVGDSDIAGDLSVDLSGQRPRLTADLRSERLDLDDLKPVTGAPPATGAGETASKEQQQDEQSQEARGRVLPDDPLDFQRVRAMDASVHFEGKRVQAGKLPIDEVLIQFTLRDSRLRFHPLRFRLGGGDIVNQIAIDATRNPPETEWQTELKSVNLREVLSELEMADESAGRLGGRAKLWMTGRSLAEALSTVDGGLYLIMNGGRLDHLLIEVAGLDAAEALGSLLGNAEPEPIDCAYADLQARSGVLRLQNVVLDTADTVFYADGRVNFNNEALDISIEPKPKDPSPLSARSRLNIGGTLSDPSVRPGSAALLKGAAAAALAAVAGPAAALIPLIEPGTGDEPAVCGNLTGAMDKAQSDQESDR